jgi:hypothetical protein
MLLEAGPIPAVDISQYPTTYDTPDFEAMVNAAWAEIDSVSLEMDALIDPTAIFDDALTGDTILSDLDEVDQINGDNAHLANLAGIAVGDTYKANGDIALTAAIQSTPGEAFTPVPATTDYGTVAQAAPTAAIAGVTLLDLTTMSGTDLRAGDQFQLQVKMDTTTGQATDYYGVRVWAELTLNGIPQPDLDLGFTDGGGLVTFKGQWQLGDVGTWSMYLHASPTTGGQVDSQLYQWTVSGTKAGTGAPRSGAVSVQLVDWTSGDLSQARVGDKWQLFVNGPPQAGVFIWGTYNGTPLTEIQLGTTDLNGDFTIADTWSAADAGAWVEYYAVGRFTWPGSLTFTVQP